MSNSADRDPVAAAIEGLLLEMQANGLGSLQTVSRTGMIALSFGEMEAEGRTLDIALVRLANAMMDDEKFSRFLIEALQPLRPSAA